MASATLNANLMEALVPRGVPDSHSVSSHNRPEEGFTSPSPLSPSSSGPSHSFLNQNHFDSSYSQFLGDSELQENSISGGEVTTEDDEGSIGENLGYYFKRSAEEPTPTSSKKRRKQVKPVRVSSVEDNDTQAPPATSQSNSFYIEMSNSSREAEFEALKCPHCHIETSSEDALRHHIIEDHIGHMLNEDNIRSTYQNMLSKRADSDPQGENFQYQEREEGEMTPLNLSSPRWESRISSQIRENGERSPEDGVSLPSSIHIPSSYGDSKFGLPGLVPLGPPPFLLPFLQQQQHSQHQDRERMHPTQQPLRPVSNGQPQIFNLEAYCDLCNKEFCNKYFLKTHKANKHGIYSPDICSSQMSASSGALSTPLIATPTNLSSNISTSSISTPLTVPSLQTSPLSSIPIPGSPFAGAFITANMSALPLRPLIPPHLHSMQKAQMGLTKNDMLGSSSKNGVINIEAYCEICQKEFCNKYFLKRHKSKIHNIDIEVTIKNTAKSHLSIGKPGYDRPEGWCDACRKDIGSRSSLNTHKLNIHGPHIIVPMSSPQENMNRTESSHDSSRDKKDNTSESVNDNFSPWDNKREDKIRDQRVEEGERRGPRIMENERIKISTSLMDINSDMKSESLKDANEFWDNRENTVMEGRRSWNEPYQKHNESDAFEPPLDESTTREPSVPIKEEPQNFSEEQTNKFMPNRSENDCEREVHSVNHDNSVHRMNKFVNKSESVREDPEDGRNNQTPVRDNLADPPRTPGACSSTDENSRELGLIARVGQPAMVQAPSGTKFTTDQLRQLGVINPDAFCELCCKEFCNKYFLRTHRIKKHGIYTPEYSDRSKQCKDHSPLSLARILERQALEMRSGMSDMDGEAECDVCRRPFPNLYLLQMHKYYIHGPGQEILQQEQLFQFQQQPFQQEHLRQLSIQAQQQKSHLQFKKSPKPPLTPLDQSQQQYSQQKQDQENNQNLPSQKNQNDQQRYQDDNHMQQEQIQQHRQQQHLQQQDQKDQQQQQQSRLQQHQQKQLNQHEHEQLHQQHNQQQQHQHQHQLQHLQTQEIAREKENHQIVSQKNLQISKSDSQNSHMVINSVQISKISQCEQDGGLKSTCREQNNDNSSISSQTSRSSPNLNRNSLNLSSPQEPDTSQGLRKLQSMILELNRQEEGSNRCKICQKDVGNKYYLRAHLMTEHGILPQGDLVAPCDGQTPKTSRDGTPISSPSSTPVMENQGFCNICKKDFFSRYILQQHMLSSHGIFAPSNNPTSFLDRIRAEIESRDDRKPISTSRSYCEICNKELCNKYFMKTHMLKMHGINIENGTSGGVTCDICRKELCSKYFLRVHKQNTHGLVDENADAEAHSEDGEMQTCSLCSRRFKNLKWLQTHLNSDHGEEGKEKWKEIEASLPNWDTSVPNYHICNVCGHQLPDLVALQIHVIKNHGANSPDREPGESSYNLEEDDMKQNFECSVCRMSFANTALLYAHEKSHASSFSTLGNPFITPAQGLQCSFCSHTLPTLEIYHQHLLHHQLQGFIKPFLKDESSSTPQMEELRSEKPHEPNNSTKETESKDQKTSTPRKRWKCYECGKKFKSRNHCLLHVQAQHSSKSRGIMTPGRSPCRKKLFRCRKCGGVAKSLSTLKKHLRKKHHSVPGVPTSHAQPSITDGHFVMQPFLLNKEGCDGPTSTFSEEQPFVPSLVYLPVARKVQRPLTVSFCLTPA